MINMEENSEKIWKIQKKMRERERDFPYLFTIFFYIFQTFSLFSSAFSKSDHCSIYFSYVFFVSFHISTYFSLEKYRRKGSGRVKRYEKYGRNPS
jgi:hypothetical protein